MHNKQYDNRFLGPFFLGSLNSFANARPVRPYPSWYRPIPPRRPWGNYPFRFF